MFSPTAIDVHVDAPLTNMLVGYDNPLLIADDIFPVLSVAKQSNIVPQLVQSDFFRNNASLRAPGTPSRGSGFKTDNTLKYFCDRYSFRYEIDDETRANADAPYDLDTIGAELVADMIGLNKEVAFATDFMTTGTWGNDDAGGTDFTQWNNYATSTPLVDITTYINEVEGRIGRQANGMVLGSQIWEKLQWHPDALDAIKYTQIGVVGQDLFRGLAGLDRFLIGRAIYTTSPEGTAEASVTYTRVWGKKALVFYAPPSPSLMTPSAGYTFTWGRVPGSIMYVVRHRNDEREVDIIEGNTYYDQKAVVTRAGTFLDTVVA